MARRPFGTPGAGDDAIYGAGGDDALQGGARSDFVQGGEGRETLAGGCGAEHLASESSLGARDRITDFSRMEGDRIDLRLLEHSGYARHFSVGASADPASVRLGTVGHDASGNATQTVYVNAHGDMAIEVPLTAGMTGLNASDFLL